jgi:hypothetical protein
MLEENRMNRLQRSQAFFLTFVFYPKGRFSNYEALAISPEDYWSEGQVTLEENRGRRHVCGGGRDKNALTYGLLVESIKPAMFFFSFDKSSSCRYIMWPAS